VRPTVGDWSMSWVLGGRGSLIPRVKLDTGLRGARSNLGRKFVIGRLDLHDTPSPSQLCKRVPGFTSF
jgi:hypothetical protein